MVNKRSGFTLVELIVVIAILGILAGIAIPVYSGYIKKANQAADETLLSAVNTAFGAACVERGVKFNSIPDNGAGLSLTGAEGHKTVDMYTASVPGTYAEPGFSLRDFQTSFEQYYGGNRDSQFKVFTSLRFEAGRGFAGVSDPNQATVGGVTFTYSDAQLYNVRNSNFALLDPYDTLDMVDSLTMGVGGNSGSVNSLTADAAFSQFMGNNGLNPAIGDDVGKALVLYAANKAANISGSTVANVLRENGGNVDAALQAMYRVVHTGEGSPTFSEKAVAAAMMYAVSTAYMNSIGETMDTNVSDKASALLALGEAYNSDGFLDYLNSDALLADANGMVSTLSVLNDNTSSILTLLNGGSFSNDALADFLDELLHGGNG